MTRNPQQTTSPPRQPGALPRPATAAWLPLLVGLLVLMAVSQHACGPSLAQHSAEEERLQMAVRRNALRWIGPEEVDVNAGQQTKVVFEIRMSPGFYVPSHDEPDSKTLATWVEPPKRSFARVAQIAYPHGTLVDFPERTEPMLAYDGVIKVGVTLAVHRNVAATRYLLPFTLHYQLCTVRGCEVPESQTVRVAFNVAAADQRGDLNELAPVD